jgi:ribonuclease D
MKMKRQASSVIDNDGNKNEVAAPITTNQVLNKIINDYKRAKFLAIDTEFIRERTYYPQLCLIQISDGVTAAAIDPLAKDLDLTPMWKLMRDQKITKVFHAGSQDMEIFLHLMGDLPRPIYDTQIAAMVCGLGDQVGYDKLVKSMLNQDIDKTSRFTDWSKRPLSNRQILYALDDVIYLAKLYPIMLKKLESEKRNHWLDEEYAKSNDPATYSVDPQLAWQKLKVRNLRPAALLRLMHLAAWREIEAQNRNIPRNRVIRDETLIDLSGSNPQDRNGFANIRNFPGGKDGKLVAPIQKILEKVASLPASSLPVHEKRSFAKRPPTAVMELLRVLLKHVSDKHEIAPRLIASADELEALASDDNTPIRALTGWRREIFGELALRLKRGEIALAVRNGKILLMEHDGRTS